MKQKMIHQQKCRISYIGCRHDQLPLSPSPNFLERLVQSTTSGKHSSMEETPKCKCKFCGYALSRAMVVYPALLFFTTGMFASSISFRYALQDTICYRLHKELKPVPIHGGNSTSANIDCEKDKDVIASTAQWNGVLVTALGLTSCITSGTVAALTDRYGRRLILV